MGVLLHSVLYNSALCKVFGSLGVLLYSMLWYSALCEVFSMYSGISHFEGCSAIGYILIHSTLGGVLAQRLSAADTSPTTLYVALLPNNQKLSVEGSSQHISISVEDGQVGGERVV